MLLGIPFAPHEKNLFLEQCTIGNGWMEHIVNFYNMLANNPFVLQMDSCIGAIQNPRHAWSKP